MTTRLLPRPYGLSVMAEAGDRFSDFEPYVASINDDGVVCFQARLGAGGSGVYTASGGDIGAVVETGDSIIREVVSHPDIDADGSVCFYAVTTAGGRGVFVARPGELATIRDSHGPLGPTMAGRGAVAFRATATPGASGIFRYVEGEATLLADDAGALVAFQGLPVINNALTVAFRADLASGGHAYLIEGGAIATVIETGGAFTELGLFPSLTDDSTVAFCATLRTGSSGIFTAHDGDIETIIDSASAHFATFRGVLVDGSGTCVFYATPRRVDAGLGIFVGPDPEADCILAVGSPLFGSMVADFALNPVSINSHGQLAIRVRLADDRQFILRADPLSLRE